MNIITINEQLNEINILLDKISKIDPKVKVDCTKKQKKNKKLFIQGSPLNFQITSMHKHGDIEHNKGHEETIIPDPSVMDLNDEYSALLKQVMYA